MTRALLLLVYSGVVTPLIGILSYRHFASKRSRPPAEPEPGAFARRRELDMSGNYCTGWVVWHSDGTTET